VAAGSTCIAQLTADGNPTDFRLSPKPDVPAVNAFYAKLLAPVRTWAFLSCHFWSVLRIARG
jgi:hypothetical protein